MNEFLARQLRQSPRHAGKLHESRHERQRVRRRLELAVRVVRQEAWQVGEGKRSPRVVGRSGEAKHGRGFVGLRRFD